jgi:nitroimidazol reductase NimA-like FMN-containing flavoprotein (pyridoxamine 5'-phosphate oxidase superfamily)
MSDDEIAAFLGETRTLTIVSQGPNGFPHPMPMWFVREAGGAIRMTTYRSSQKVLNITRDAHVALSAEAGERYGELRGVVVYGQAEILADTALVLDTMRGAARGEDASTIHAMEKTAGKRVVIRVVPERVVSWDHRKLGGVY